MCLEGYVWVKRVLRFDFSGIVQMGVTICFVRGPTCLLHGLFHRLSQGSCLL